MRKFLSYISIIIFLLGCTKFGKNLTVRGKVINAVTGVGIPDQEIQLLRDGGGYFGGYKEVKKTYTDANGEYEINKLGLRTYYINHNRMTPLYEVGTIVNGVLIPVGIDQFKVKKGKKQTVDFLVVPYGCSAWHIKNINCEGVSDTMWYKIKYQFDEDFLDLWSLPITGCADITSNGCDKLEMGNHILYIRVKRPSQEIYFYDTLNVNDVGTSYYDLFY